MNNGERFKFKETAARGLKALRLLLILTGLGYTGLAGSLFAATTAQTQLRFRVDTVAPDAISDLEVQTATGTEGSVILNWTEPGTDGMTGQASQYIVRFSTDGNINDLTDFSTGTAYSPTWTPGSGGGLAAQTADGLIPGQTYYWSMRAQDGAGLIGTWSRTAGANPNNFAVAWDSAPWMVQGSTLSSSNEQLTLNWNALSLAARTTDFDFYRVYRSTDPAFASQLAVTTTTSLSYIDPNLMDITTYFYRVVGVDRGETSAPSYPGHALESVDWSTVSARPLLPAPTGFGVLSVTTETITWSWVDNASAENGFNVLSSTGGVMGSTEAAPAKGTIASWTETGLAPGASYYRYSVAYQTEAVSGASNSSAAYTLANPPLNLISSTQTAQTVSLSWDTNNNSPATRYLVERATYPSVVYAQIADTTASAFISTGLAEGATYNYQLTARNGDGVLSAAIQLTTSAAIVSPSAITNLQSLPSSQSGTIHLSWMAPGDDGTAGNIAGGLYDIRWSSVSLTNDADYENIGASSRKIVSTSAVAGAAQGTLVTGLELNTTYYFAIKTRDEIPNNYSAISNIVIGDTSIDISSPSNVTDLRMGALSNTSALVTWTTPGDDGASFDNFSGQYDIRYATSPIASPALFQSAQSVSAFGTIPVPGVAGSSQTMTLANLSLDTTYYLAMITRDEALNTSELSNGATLYTPDLIAPSPVLNLTAAANLTVGSRIDLHWNNPSTPDLSGVRIIVSSSGFAATPSTAGATYFDLVANSGTGFVIPSSYSHTNLAIGVTYYYSLFAFDDVASPNFSAASNASAAAAQSVLAAPERPKNVSAMRSAQGQTFTINWATPTLRVDGSSLTAGELAYYRIYKTERINGATTQIFLNSVSSGTSLTDSLAGTAINYYKVRAVNLAGTESEDSDVVGTPVDPITGQPTDGDVYIIMDDSISYIRVPGGVMNQIYQSNIQITGQRNLAQEGGKVFKSVNVFATDGNTGAPINRTIFDTPVSIAIGYLVDGSGVVSNGAPSAAMERALPAAAEAPSALSVYWFNGAEWLKLGTSIDSANNSAIVKSRHLGGYQLRLVQQAGIQHNSVFPRTITPNGDNSNDIVFFFFENQTGAPVRGTIYDLRSMKVGNVSESNIFVSGTSVLTWDGKDESGATVPGGVYLYKIEVGGETFTGTVTVAR